MFDEEELERIMKKLTYGYFREPCEWSYRLTKKEFEYLAKCPSQLKRTILIRKGIPVVRYYVKLSEERIHQKESRIRTLRRINRAFDKIVLKRPTIRSFILNDFEEANNARIANDASGSDNDASGPDNDASGLSSDSEDIMQEPNVPHEPTIPHEPNQCNLENNGDANFGGPLSREEFMEIVMQKAQETYGVPKRRMGNDEPCTSNTISRPIENQYISFAQEVASSVQIPDQPEHSMLRATIEEDPGTSNVEVGVPSMQMQLATEQSGRSMLRTIIEEDPGTFNVEVGVPSVQIPDKPEHSMLQTIIEEDPGTSNVEVGVPSVQLPARTRHLTPPRILEMLNAAVSDEESISVAQPRRRRRVRRQDRSPKRIVAKRKRAIRLKYNIKNDWSVRRRKLWIPRFAHIEENVECIFSRSEMCDVARKLRNPQYVMYPRIGSSNAQQKKSTNSDENATPKQGFGVPEPRPVRTVSNVVVSVDCNVQRPDENATPLPIHPVTAETGQQSVPGYLGKSNVLVPVDGNAQRKSLWKVPLMLPDWNDQDQAQVLPEEARQEEVQPSTSAIPLNYTPVPTTLPSQMLKKVKIIREGKFRQKISYECMYKRQQKPMRISVQSLEMMKMFLDVHKYCTENNVEEMEYLKVYPEYKKAFDVASMYRLEYHGLMKWRREERNRFFFKPNFRN